MNILEEFGVNLAEAKNDSCLVQTLPKVNCSHSLSRSLDKNFPNDFFQLFLLKMLLLLIFFFFCTSKTTFLSKYGLVQVRVTLNNSNKSS